MIGLLWGLAGCGWLGGSGGGATVPLGPDPVATAAAVDALCKLYEGAATPCERGVGSVTAHGETLDVKVVLDSAEEAFGQFTWSGVVEVTVAGDPVRTRARSYGWGPEEAYERGFHEWAVVVGVAIVDWRLGSRAALKALEPDVGDEAWALAGRPVLRGWSLVRGLTEGNIDHGTLLEALAPSAAGLAAGRPHALRLVVTTDLGAEPVWACEIDGVQDDALCAAAQTYPWPKGTVWEAKQLYLVLP